MSQMLSNYLSFLYGEEKAVSMYNRLQQLLHTYQTRILPKSLAARVDETDAILITYGDMVQAEQEAPLHTLAAFLHQYVHNVISCVHILPFYPYSSDDGFSVIDYKAVNPDLGGWEDVGRIGAHFRLMFDAVINHISVESDWFQGFLDDDPKYRNYFTVVDPDTDISQVFRPRALPLLTPVETAGGTKHVWTTFSTDQVDLNYKNSDVLLDIIDTLLYYVAQGAEFIRLDAIAFMWKEIGTSSIHRPQTHAIIQLMRAILDEAAPHVSLITETNVPHEDNISYFGDGTNEAQMVYNFSLPPLTLHAFHAGNAEALSRWAAGLDLPSDQVTFFNFLASHDGIGVTPARGILPDTAVTAMAERVQALGGYVSYKTNSDGSQSPYELNCNYLDALGDPDVPDEPVVHIARRFLASQAIMLALRGVPGIYFHSLFGSRNWYEGVNQTGRYRTINRQKLSRSQLESELADRESLRYQVFNGYRKLLKARTADPAFHPNGKQQVLPLHESVFAVWRLSRDGRSRVLCLHNVANKALDVVIDAPAPTLTELVSGERYTTEVGQLKLTLSPYDVRWLKINS